MIILALETSCDETAAAVVEDGRVVRSSAISSSRAAFEKSGGVIPEEAARKQVECMLPVLEQSLAGLGLEPERLDAIAVTKGPGLLGSLLVGTMTARILASVWKRPLVPVHHTLGHLSSTWLEVDSDPVFPILTLSASGGHTELWLRQSHTRGTLLGRTRDDAAGEAFDKGASLLGLPYPGGPAIAALAEKGDPTAFDFPLPLAKEDTLDFSFSGLKTALRYLLRDLSIPVAGIHESQLRNIAASYQHALCRHLTDRASRAIVKHPEIKEVHLVGGVSANRHLRTLVERACGATTMRVPMKMSYCTDNAAMIGAAAAFIIAEKGLSVDAWQTDASIPLAAAL